MWCWRRTEKIKWSQKVNEHVLERIGEKKTLLNNILRRIANWIGHNERTGIENHLWFFDYYYYYFYEKKLPPS